MDGPLDIATVTLARHKIDVAQYMRMAEAGILRRRERAELIEGEVIDMAPIGPSHDGAIVVLSPTCERFRRKAQGRAADRRGFGFVARL